MRQLTLLYLLRDGQVLLAHKKRGFGADKWNGVGGKVEANETIEQAMVRECQEEIGVTPTLYKPAGVMLFEEIFGAQKEKVQIHLFVCSAWEGEPSESEEMAPKWFGVDGLPLEVMWGADKHWLPTVLAGKTISADFELDDQDKVSRYEVTETGVWK